jgi:hypothetical protein
VFGEWDFVDCEFFDAIYRTSSLPNVVNNQTDGSADELLFEIYIGWDHRCD